MPEPTAPSMGTPDEAAVAALDDIVEALSTQADLQRASMFGMPSARRRGGKAFAGIYGTDLVLKLDGPAHAEALTLSGAHLFEPMAGRPMKQWVVVPAAHRDRWLELAREALGSTPA